MLTWSLPSFTFQNVLICSTLLRVGLILYSEWHDAHSLVKYTDVDYRVFTDAAAFLLQASPGSDNRAQGPLKSFLGYDFSVGSPYARATYRYTPLLALLLTPNGWLHPSFGKYVFAACDLLNGWLIYRISLTQVLPYTDQSPGTTKSSKKVNPYVEERREQLATVYSAVHLLNPLVFSISTRGSSESVLSLFILAMLHAALSEKWDLAAVLLGLSTHWKIYPVIYGVSLLGVITATSSQKGLRHKSYILTLVNRKTIRFGVISASTFLLLGALCYSIWGYPFLFESYLYHLHRLDHRHNFSPYFYLTYLTYPSSSPTAAPMHLSWWNKLLRSPLTSFVPQMGLALGLGLLFGRQKKDLIFAWFSQTVAFVVFNKVCTSQYFLWYLLLLPLLLPRLSTMTWRRAVSCIGVWAATQGLWLSEAYKLEFLGENVFFGLWVRGLVYVIGHCWVLVQIMKAYR